MSYPVSFVVVFFGAALPEEIGWRGFALPRMQPRYGPLWGTLLLGVLWAFWHLLYFLTPDHGGGPGTSLAPFLISFSVFFLMVVALAIIFTLEITPLCRWNNHKFVQKDDLFSWLCYGWEIAEAATLSGNASLEICHLHAYQIMNEVHAISITLKNI